MARDRRCRGMVARPGKSSTSDRPKTSWPTIFHSLDPPSFSWRTAVVSCCVSCNGGTSITQAVWVTTYAVDDQDHQTEHRTLTEQGRKGKFSDTWSLTSTSACSTAGHFTLPSLTFSAFLLASLRRFSAQKQYSIEAIDSLGYVSWQDPCCAQWRRGFESGNDTTMLSCPEI